MGPKRIVAAIQSEPVTFNAAVNPPGSGVPGGAELGRLVNGALTQANDQQQPQPQLADAVPSTENGQWKVLPDGSMETTWRIRPGALWHDGAPFTTEDVLFTARVLQDRELPILRETAYDNVQSIEAIDARTVTVKWSRPFIQADTLFQTPALPRHLLERAFTANKAAFTQLPYWTQDFVGTGPFQVKDLARGSHVLLGANPSYVLGRPLLDEIEVKFILDATTLAANLLAGAVDLTLGRALSLEQAAEVRDQWRDGGVQISTDSWLVMYPQFMNPSPAVVADAQFRRALMHAIDRQAIADVLQGGLVPVAHFFLNPNEPEHADVQASAVRYEYDPRRTGQIIEGLGYARGADGMFRDRANQVLTIEGRVSANRDLNVKTNLAVADYWQKAGIMAEPIVMPPQRAQDREYVQTFPAFILYNQPANLSFLKRIRIDQTPLPDNGYVGNNNSRYINQEFDELIERVFLTIPRNERMDLVRQLVRRTTDEVLLLGLFYQAQPALIAKRLDVRDGSVGSAHLWDVRA